MTTTRAKVAISLASRGRPLMWANEQEAAVLSGVGIERFRSKVVEWERRGFPQVNPENGKRSIPAILAFWALPQNHSGEVSPPMPPEDGEEVENWNGYGQRLSS